MAEDRPLNDAAAELAALRQEHEDFKSTMLARLPMMPTGTMLPTLATTPPAGTLLLQGQTVSRTTYARLWQWVQDTSAGGFGPGDGSTTFTLPDARDRALVGASATIPLGSTGGAATRTLTVANLPAHDHNVAAASGGAHGHGGSTGASGGNHGAHNETYYSVRVGIPGEQYGLYTADSPVGNTSHVHPLDLDDAPGHTHPVTETAVGSGTAFDNRPPYIGVNVVIWT